MKALRVLVAYLKLAWVGLFTIGMLSRVFLLQALSPKSRHATLGLNTMHRWSKWAMRTIGVRVRIHGELPESGTLLVANHITYVDPPLLLAAIKCTMLAKEEVSKYPLIGPGAKAVGVLFVKREAEGSRAAAQKAIAEGLQAGRTVGIFPEGTTSPDGVVQYFRPGSFKAAAQVGAPVVPVAITYKETSLAWLGKEHLVPHFIRCHALGKVTVDVWIGPRLRHLDPEYLRTEAENWVRQKVVAVKGPASMLAFEEALRQTA